MISRVESREKNESRKRNGETILAVHRKRSGYAIQRLLPGEFSPRPAHLSKLREYVPRLSIPRSPLPHRMTRGMAPGPKRGGNSGRYSPLPAKMEPISTLWRVMRDASTVRHPGSESAPSAIREARVAALFRRSSRVRGGGDGGMGEGEGGAGGKADSSERGDGVEIVWGHGRPLSFVRPYTLARSNSQAARRRRVSAASFCRPPRCGRS